MKKRIIPVLLLLLLLGGCAAPDSYLTVRPHAGGNPQTIDTDAVTAENYAELKKAVLGFVERGQTHGAIHATNYEGNVEEDLTRATYEVMKLDPLGAYAVEYMSCDCTLIISYYEIHIETTFRRTLQEIEAVEPIGTTRMLQERLEKAAKSYEPHLALRLSGYREQDAAEVIRRYCRAHRDTIMEEPKIRVSVYPDRGSVRILELELEYEHTKDQLRSMELAVRESVDAAAEYIRYRTTDWDKLELLYTYLMERFYYISQDTTTPVYDALCQGICDPVGLSTAWQMICDRAGLECYTVDGLRDGEDYTWNILRVDGQYRHLDLGECVGENKPLTLLTDSAMGGYYWNTARYPACPAAPAPAEPEETPEAGQETEPEKKSEEQPQEETPAEPEEDPAEEPAAPVEPKT